MADYFVTHDKVKWYVNERSHMNSQHSLLKSNNLCPYLTSQSRRPKPLTQTNTPSPSPPSRTLTLLNTRTQGQITCYCQPSTCLYQCLSAHTVVISVEQIVADWTQVLFSVTWLFLSIWPHVPFSFDTICQRIKVNVIATQSKQDWTAFEKQTNHVRGRNVMNII